ncbi:MAG TPA: helix-turn-helix domain-containing protein [Streptosporangiaceae bacterium]|nr:helix-turn-helix domain-containing protein [Streptosporangiaceae bacterium]
MTVKMPRTYDATRRQEQARENRARVLGAARARFLADGYAATTIPAVAREAGVSVQTVYKAFANKAGLLKAVFDVAVTGDDQPIPVAGRDQIKRIQAEPDPQSKLRMYAEYFVQGAQRAVAVGLLARDAASGDPAAADVWDQIQRQRLTGMGQFARHLHADGHLPASTTVEEARDILWTFTSPELWNLLVIQRGWTPAHYGHWLAGMLTAALLTPQPPRS